MPRITKQQIFEESIEKVQYKKLKRIPSSKNSLEEIENKEVIERMFEGVKDNPVNNKCLAVVKEKYLNNMTYLQLGKEHNISRGRAQQIVKSGIRKLRDVANRTNFKYNIESYFQ